MKTYFDHERLDVYREAIAFCGWNGRLREDELGYSLAAEYEQKHE